MCDDIYALYSVTYFDHIKCDYFTSAGENIPCIRSVCSFRVYCEIGWNLKTDFILQ